VSPLYLELVFHRRHNGRVFVMVIFFTVSHFRMANEMPLGKNSSDFNQDFRFGKKNRHVFIHDGIKHRNLTSYYAFTLPFTFAITSSAIPDGAGA
jgi:hypothetical protein